MACEFPNIYFGVLLIFSEDLDPVDCHQPIMTLLFLMTLNDTFEENVERIMN